MKNKLNKKIKNKVVNSIGVLGVLISFASIWPFAKLENYPQWLLFVLYLILLALIFAFTFYTVLIHYYPVFKNFRTKNEVGLIHSVFFTSILLFIFIGILTNSYNVKNSTLRKYKIERASLNKSSRSRPSYIFIINDKNKRERLQYGKAFVKSVENQDSVLIYVNEGILGFEFYSIQKK